jgi:hypothetical protein
METVKEKSKSRKVGNKLAISGHVSKNFFVEKNGKKMLVETESANEIMQRRNPAYKFLM